MELPQDVAITITLTLLTQQITSRIFEVSTQLFLLLYILTNALTLLATPTTPSRLLYLNLIFTILLTTLTYIRRLFFHPLSRFPGSKIAAVTCLHNAYKNWDGQGLGEIAALHEKHGDFIRTAPDELHVNNVECIMEVYPKKAGSLRGPFYEINSVLGGVTMHGCRDNALHTKWRRIWDQAFSQKNVAAYSPRVVHHVEKLISVIDALGGKDVETGNLFNFFAYDVMADLAFDHDAKVQDRIPGRENPIEYLHKAMQTSNGASYIRNLCDLFPLLPNPAVLRSFLASGQRLFQARVSGGAVRDDIFSHLLAKDPESGSGFTKVQLIANTQVIIVAGTDTTAVTLTALFTELAKNLDIQSALYDELHSTFSSAEEIQVETIKTLPYLNACINEALRLWPAVPGGARYCTPSGGVTINGTYIPGLVGVKTSPDLLMKDPRYFVDGGEYIPERWTSRPQLVKDRRAFIPFSYGPHSCVGKALAMNEMRLVVAQTVYGFETRKGEGWSEEKWRGEWRDYFTASPGEAMLRFIKRSGEAR